MQFQVRFLSNIRNIYIYIYKILITIAKIFSNEEKKDGKICKLDIEKLKNGDSEYKEIEYVYFRQIVKEGEVGFEL